MKTDLPSIQHLPRLHYGLSAVVAVTAAAVGVPVAAGWRALARPELYADPLGGAGLGAPSSGGWIFLVGGAVAVALGLLLAVALAVAGRAIAARRRLDFCLATSLAASFFFPLGTLLGFHTIAVLSEPEVRRAFGGRAPPAGPA